MVEEEVKLPKLEFVRVGDAHHLASLGRRFVNLAFYYRRPINQLNIQTDNANFSLDVSVDNIVAYFCRSTALKHLRLKTG
ncbi:hypothetical protein [Parasitella parasitica]|uniref:Uncharacterized protein n=1 Tax=Parasitella parasitica TaxID=35722 RepID=A0A0B7N1D6_9FUNG|nr:hypothetical protein [Parasitella parasitica]